MRIVLLSILLAVGMASYRAVQIDAQQQQETVPGDSIVIKQLPTRLPPKVKDSVPVQHIAHLDSTYSSAPLYFEEGGHFYFIVANGTWSKYYATDTAPKFLLGIVDENYNTILPVAYHKLYTPNATAKGYIEIERDGKRGLLNYHTRQVIPATYDVVFPSQAKGVVAIGRRGCQYYDLLPDGTEQLITDRALYPHYSKMIDDLAFDIKDHTVLNLISSYIRTAQSKERVYSVSYGVIVPPSYIVETGFVPSWIDGVGPVNDYRLFTIDKAHSKVEHSHATNWGISMIVSSFYQEGISSRNGFYSRSTKLLAVIDSNNNVKGKEPLSNEYRFIGDTLLELSLMAQSDDDFPEGLLPYHLITDRKYFEITKMGEIKPLTCNRLFACTKYLYLTEDYFKGRYSIINGFGDIDTLIDWPDDDQTDFYITDHLSADDLDLMYHEILADYGYKFKDAKWDSLFRQQPWYNPCYDNVDQLLNPYDKANMKFIKSTREKVAKKPEKYIHGKFEGYPYRKH